ncbi:MAG: MFS transporter [Candidatus Binatia bacterium]
MLLPIFLVVLVDIFAFTLVIPLLAIYAEHLGASPLQATLLVSVFAVCQLVSGPLLGRISDRVGRKPMLLVSQLGTLIGLLVMGSATSLALLFLGRVIDGLTAGNLSLAQAYIADNTKPENRARSFGIIGIAFGLGFFLGPSTTAYLVQYGLHAPFHAAAALSFASIVVTALLLPNQAPARDPRGRETGPGGQRLRLTDWGTYAQYFRRPVLSGLLAQFFFFAFAFTTFTSGFALFAERTFRWGDHPFTPREIGYLFAYAGFLGIVLQGGLIGRLVKRFGEPALVSAGFALMGVGYLLLGLIHDIAPLIVVTTLVALGQGLLRPALTSLISQHADRTEQGMVLGLTQSLTSTAQVVAPPIGGWLIGAGYLELWAFVAALAAGLGWLAASWGSARAVLADTAVTSGASRRTGA